MKAHGSRLDSASSIQARDIDTFLAGRRGREPGWMTDLRRDALARLAECGLPTTQDENWKYTQAGPLATMALAAPLAPEHRPPGSAFAGLDLAGAMAAAHLNRWPEGPVLVFGNGAFLREASRLPEPGGNVRIESLATALAENPATLDVLKDAPDPQDGFSFLNAALAFDGAIIRIAAGTSVGTPIVLLFLSAPEAGQNPPVWHTRNLLDAGAQSRVEIVEIHSWLAEGPHLNNSSTHVRVAPGAKVTHTLLQRDALAGFHVARIGAKVGGDAHFSSRAISLGAALARCDIAVRLVGQGASCTVDGLYRAEGTQHVDVHTAISHDAPHTTSSQLYKGIAAGSATAVFNGKVVVKPGSRAISAQQTNRNLLLSDQAQVFTKPQLEIFADDVKCSHGATVGQLDEGAMFYLRSRGLSWPEARAILVRAFAEEVLAQIEPAALRDAVEVQG